jgi:hypothetical protein
MRPAQAPNELANEMSGIMPKLELGLDCGTTRSLYDG